MSMFLKKKRFTSNCFLILEKHDSNIALQLFAYAKNESSRIQEIYITNQVVLLSFARLVPVKKQVFYLMPPFLWRVCGFAPDVWFLVRKLKQTKKVNSMLSVCTRSEEAKFSEAVDIRKLISIFLQGFLCIAMKLDTNKHCSATIQWVTFVSGIILRGIYKTFPKLLNLYWIETS